MGRGFVEMLVIDVHDGVLCHGLEHIKLAVQSTTVKVMNLEEP